MEKFKIELYEDVNGKNTFPSFKTLGKDECTPIQNNIRHLFDLPEDSTLLEIVNKVEEVEVHLNVYDAQDDNFSLIPCFKDMGVVVSDNVYLNWYRYDEIDIMAADDLINNFDDIWFPSSDDLDIFDSSFEWILSVQHDGMIFWVNLKSTS